MWTRRAGRKNRQARRRGPGCHGAAAAFRAARFAIPFRRLLGLLCRNTKHHETEAAMRKIIESTLVSADGVVGSPPLWAMDYRDEEVTRDALERLSGSDAMLMGRGTYELFAATWPSQAGDFAQRMNGIRKYVFSSTLTNAGWSNSTIVRGDVLAEVKKIKEQDGRDLALFGHGRLAQTLLDNGLT